MVLTAHQRYLTSLLLRGNGGCSDCQQLEARRKARSPLRPARPSAAGSSGMNGPASPARGTRSTRDLRKSSPPRDRPRPPVTRARASPGARHERCRPRRLRLLTRRLERRGDANEPTVSAAPSHAGASCLLALVRRRRLPPPRPSRAGVGSSHLASLAQARCSLRREDSSEVKTVSSAGKRELEATCRRRRTFQTHSAVCLPSLYLCSRSPLLLREGASRPREGRRGEAAPLRLRVYGGRKEPKSEPR